MNANKKANGLTRREIMQKLGIEKKDRYKFNLLCNAAGLKHISEKRERHVVTYLYPSNSVEILKPILDQGDRRKFD